MKKFKLAYIFDGVMPKGVAEQEQVVHTLSALSPYAEQITLFAPLPNNAPTPKRSQIKEIFHTDVDFEFEWIRSHYPSVRGIEKLSHVLYTARLKKLLQQYDLVYTRNIPAIFMALALKIPVLYDTYRPWPIQHKTLKYLFKGIFKSPYFLGMALHSDYARQAYIDSGLEEERAIVAYNGFNPKAFEPKMTKKGARKVLELPANKQIALYSGRLAVEKGLHNLLDLAEHFTNVDFILIGSQENGEIEQRAEKYSNVKVLPWISAKELVSYLYASDILMLPPTGNALYSAGNTVLPIKIFSYLAAGRTIFAGRTPDVMELLKHKENAYLVDIDDKPAAIEGFRDLLESDGLMDALSDNAKALSETLTWGKRGERLAQFIQKRRKDMRV